MFSKEGLIFGIINVRPPPTPPPARAVLQAVQEAAAAAMRTWCACLRAGFEHAPQLPGASAGSGGWHRMPTMVLCVQVIGGSPSALVAFLLCGAWPGCTPALQQRMPVSTPAAQRLAGPDPRVRVQETLALFSTCA